MTSKERIEEIKMRLEKIKSGVWRSMIEGRDHEAGSNFIATDEGDIELIGASDYDQDFIAQSKADIPFLLNYIEDLENKLNVN